MFQKNQEGDNFFKQTWKPINSRIFTWTLRNLSISASCRCSSLSMSSPINDNKAESAEEAIRVLSSDKPNPVDTGRACRKSTDDICELFSKKSCSFNLFLLGSKPLFHCKSAPPSLPSVAFTGPGANPTTWTAIKTYT